MIGGSQFEDGSDNRDSQFEDGTNDTLGAGKMFVCRNNRIKIMLKYFEPPQFYVRRLSVEHKTAVNELKLHLLMVV